MGHSVPFLEEWSISVCVGREDLEVIHLGNPWVWTTVVGYDPAFQGEECGRRDTALEPPRWGLPLASVQVQGGGGPGGKSLGLPLFDLALACAQFQGVGGLGGNVPESPQYNLALACTQFRAENHLWQSRMISAILLTDALHEDVHRSGLVCVLESGVSHYL